MFVYFTGPIMIDTLLSLRGNGVVCYLLDQDLLQVYIFRLKRTISKTSSNNMQGNYTIISSLC